ncbi:MAG: DUF1592 domain-containing protein [Acidobacteriota bacterium]
MMRRALLVLGVVACSGGSDAYDYAHSKGAALYQDQCQVCHGETGEGGLGPALRDSSKSTDELASIIAARMPANNPGQCTGDCATQLADFIHDGLTSKALSCDHVAPTTPRRLRLLTRREYRATIRDLFGSAAPAMTCARATDCTYRDTCTAGACEASACDAQTFVYDPQGKTYHSVHVAGDFNNWPQTIAAGGLALTYSPSTRLWVGTFAIGAGSHSYKLVLDEQTWIADPRAPQSAPDGFGGQNSLVALSCTGPQPLGDPAAAFPVETRRAGFPFDTDSDAALVSSAHIDAYLDAAEKVAAFVGAPASIADVGHRLFRRPLTADETTRYSAMDPQTALTAMLMSPSFLYRSELGEPDGNGHYKLRPFEIATALSYTFLGTTPGDDLLAAAESGELNKPAGIEKWARQLLADPRARDQVGELVAQWANAKGVLTVDKRADLYPDFDDATRTALLAETEHFAAAAVFDGAGTYGELMTASYTVLDPVSAAFYGIQGTGQVTYPDGRRAGLLAHASLLAATAHSDQTSPVQRGLLVRRNFLCEELPPPPPFGGGLPAVDPNATTRERFAMHSTAPACHDCHTYIDGVGFGLESYDPVGRWRDQENGKPIDASGDVEDLEQLGVGTSTKFQSEPELAQAIATSQAGPACFVRQYLRFSRGLRETLAERCGRLAVDKKWHGDVKELMVQSVLSPDFVQRRAP